MNMELTIALKFLSGPWSLYHHVVKQFSHKFSLLEEV